MKYDGEETIQFDVSADEIVDFQVFNDDNIFCVSYGGQVFWFEGFGWSLLTDLNSIHAKCISGTSPHDLWVGGFYYSTANTRLFHYNGVEWTQTFLPDNQYGVILTIEAISPTDIWVGGAFTIEGHDYDLFHYNGNLWQPVDNPAGSSIKKIKFTSNIGWAIDSDGNFLRYSAP